MTSGVFLNLIDLLITCTFLNKDGDRLSCGYSLHVNIHWRKLTKSDFLSYTLHGLKADKVYFVNMFHHNLFPTVNLVIWRNDYIIDLRQTAGYTNAHCMAVCSFDL